MSASRQDEHATMVADCETRESKLTDWERSFIDRIGRKLADSRALTDGEVSKLDEIWERVT